MSTFDEQDQSNHNENVQKKNEDVSSATGDLSRSSVVASPAPKPKYALVGILSFVIGAVVSFGVFYFALSDRVDGTVATVNDVAITKDTLYDTMFELVGKNTVDELIRVELVKEEAKKLSVSVDQKEVEKEFEEIKKSYPSPEQFEQQVKEAGVTEETIKKNIESGLLFKKLIEKKYPLTEAKLKEHFEQNKSTYDVQEQVRASHILVKDKAEAVAIKKQLDQGTDFAKLAKEKSVDGSAQQGGDLGFFGRGQMVPPFEQAAFSLPIGKVSDPVESEFGFHLIKVLEKKPAKNAVFEEEKENVKKQLLEQQVSEKAEPYLEELKKKAKIDNPYAEKETKTEEPSAPETPSDSPAAP